MDDSVYRRLSFTNKNRSCLSTPQAVKGGKHTSTRPPKHTDEVEALPGDVWSTSIPGLARTGVGAGFKLTAVWPAHRLYPFWPCSVNIPQEDPVDNGITFQMAQDPWVIGATNGISELRVVSGRVWWRVGATRM